MWTQVIRLQFIIWLSHVHICGLLNSYALQFEYNKCTGNILNVYFSVENKGTLSFD